MIIKIGNYTINTEQVTHTSYVDGKFTFYFPTTTGEFGNAYNGAGTWEQCSIWFNESEEASTINDWWQAEMVNIDILHPMSERAQRAQGVEQ